MNYNTASTEIIIEACKKKDQKAQMELYERYYDPLYRAAFNILKNRDDALDAMQEGFIIAFNKLDQYVGKGSFEGWLRKIVIRKSIANYHLRKKHVAVDSLENQTILSENPKSEEISITSISTKVLESALNKLKEHYSLILKLFYLEGYSHEEIGEIMNVSSGYSRTLLSRARVTLKKHLHER